MDQPTTAALLYATALAYRAWTKSVTLAKTIPAPGLQRRAVNAYLAYLRAKGRLIEADPSYMELAGDPDDTVLTRLDLELAKALG